MSHNLHRAIIMGEDVTSVTAALDERQLTAWKAHKLHHAMQFDPQTQVNMLQSEGYNVHVLYEYEQIHLISAIPPDSPLTHPQWIMACADYLNLVR